jgi:hypothetical protein
VTILRASLRLLGWHGAALRICAGASYGVHIEILVGIAAAAGARSRASNFAGLPVNARAFTAFGF